MKAGNVYSTFVEMKLQNGNEINYLVEGCSGKNKKKKQSPILLRFPGNDAKKMVGSGIAAIILQLLGLPSLLLSTRLFVTNLEATVLYA